MDRAPRNIGHLDAMEREQELRDRLAASQERERMLREALEWYADPKTWHRQMEDWTTSAGVRITTMACPADKDTGDRARAALADTPGPRIAPRP